MSANHSANKNTSDEIDLRQIFGLINQGFKNISHKGLIIYKFTKNRILWILGLAILGILIGYLLKSVLNESNKLDIVVSPRFDNKAFLYDVIEEVNTSIEEKDTTFFSAMGISMPTQAKMSIKITPLSDSELRNDAIIELLKEFNNSDAISDVLRRELEARATQDQKISFIYKEDIDGYTFAEKLMAYINSNEYYTNLQKTHLENAGERLTKNDTLITQIDLLIQNYTENLVSPRPEQEGRVVLDTEESLDVTSLLQLKNTLIRDNELKRLELVEHQQPLLIKSFGNPYVYRNPVLAYSILWFPLSFVLFYLLFIYIKFLNGRVKELN